MRVACLETPRLILRPYEEADLEKFEHLNADGAVRQHMGGPLTRAAARRLFDSIVTPGQAPGNAAWAVLLRSTREYAGHVFCVVREGTDYPELGFLLERRFWGQGLAAEAAKAVLDQLLSSRNCPCVKATVDLNHSAAIRVLEKIGMSLEGARRDSEGPYAVYAFHSSTGS